MHIHQEKPTIMDLPNEMLEHIFSHLEFRESLAASLVCHRWNQTALQLNKIRLNVSTAEESIFELFRNSERPYRHLGVNDAPLVVELITKFGNNLESLIVNPTNDLDWLGYLCELPNLKELTIQCYDRYCNLNVSPSRPCLSLRSLSMEYIDYELFKDLRIFIEEAFPELRHLKMEYLHGFFRLPNLPMLESLELSGMHDLDGDLFQDLQRLPELHTIALTGLLQCIYPGQELVNDHIRTVHIRADNLLSDWTLLRLTEVFPAMTCFRSGVDVTACSAEGIETARKALPNCVFHVEPSW